MGKDLEGFLRLRISRRTEHWLAAQKKPEKTGSAKLIL
jgi:hypothetical protein